MQSLETIFPLAARCLGADVLSIILATSITTKGIAEDPMESVRWFTAAAEEGDYPPAMRRLADAHWVGAGVQQDAEKAFHLYYTAAKMMPDLWPAHYALGRAYRTGQGCIQNYTAAGKAYMLLRIKVQKVD